MRNGVDTLWVIQIHKKEQVQLFLYIQQQNAVNDDDEWMDDMIYKILFTQSSIFVVCDTNVTLRIAFVMHSPIQFINDNFNI